MVYMKVRDTVLYSPGLCGPDEIIDIMPMPYDGETGSDTPRLCQVVPLQCSAQVDQSIGTGHGT